MGDHTEGLARGLKAWLLFLLSPLASCENAGRHLISLLLIQLAELLVTCLLEGCGSGVGDNSVRFSLWQQKARKGSTLGLHSLDEFDFILMADAPESGVKTEEQK